MEKILPGIHLLPRGVRRFLGWSLVVFVVVIVAVPIIVIASAGPACGGGYPDKWCRQPLDSVVDSWGMYNRECVSYTAYRVANSGRVMPFGFGDANKWPAAARAHDIPVSSTPQVGDVAIKMGGKHGHSMYVEAVNADGTISISEYNKNKTGTYQQETLQPTGLVFIHF
jgi:surface antigen